MRSISAALAIFTGVVTGLFAFMTVMTAPFGATQVVAILISFGFLIGGIVAALGKSVWPLRGAWAAAIVGLIYAVATAKGGVGLFEGGMMILLVLVYLLTGLVLSLFAQLPAPRVRKTGTP